MATTRGALSLTGWETSDLTRARRVVIYRLVIRSVSGVSAASGAEGHEDSAEQRGHRDLG